MFRKDTGQGTFILNPETCCLQVFQSCQCQDPLFPAWFLPRIQSCNSQHGKHYLPNILLFFSLLIVKEMRLLGSGGRAGGSHVPSWKNYISQPPLQPELVSSDQKTKAEHFKEQGTCVLSPPITADVWKSGTSSPKEGERSPIQRGKATPGGSLETELRESHQNLLR